MSHKRYTEQILEQAQWVKDHGGSLKEYTLDMRLSYTELCRKLRMRREKK